MYLRGHNPIVLLFIAFHSITIILRLATGTHLKGMGYKKFNLGF